MDPTITPWRYEYGAGPQSVAEIGIRVEAGNCRRLVQRHVAATRGVLLRPEDVLNPRLFRSTGEFVRRSRPMSLEGLPDGAVVFAERRLNRAGEAVDRGPDQFDDEAGWAWHLHTAVVLVAYDPGAPWLDDAMPVEGVEPGEPALLHSTGFRETVVVWGVREFVAHYVPVAAKLITQAPTEPVKAASTGLGTRGHPRAATTFDTMSIHQLREDLAEWMLMSGIEQWERGEIKPWHIADQIEDGEWWVVDAADGADGIVAAVRILEHDPTIWPDGDADGHRYVHGLMVDRNQTGQGIGARILDWVAAEARRAGATALRLDCVESNARLCDYYRARGFRIRGRVDLPQPWHPVVLWERALR